MTGDSVVENIEGTIQEVSSILFGSNNETAIDNSVSTTEDPFFQDTFFHPTLIKDDASCKAILHVHIGSSNIRVWDILHLIPNICFLMFLFFRLASTRLRLRTINSNVINMFYSVVVALAITSATRCFIAIILFLSNPSHDITDSLIWECCHMIFLTTEISVGILAMSAGRNDNLRHCRIVIFISGLVSLIVSSIQLYFELSKPYYGFMILKSGYHIYGQGGPVFIAVKSFLMVLFYFTMFTLRMTPVKHEALVSPGFRYNTYVVTMISLNIISCVGAAMLAVQINSGLCLDNMAKYFYFSCFAPVIFFCFLQSHFSTSQSNFQFSYRSQLDEEDEYHEDDLYGNISISSNISNEHM